jgi:hypothetical protein
VTGSADRNGPGGEGSRPAAEYPPEQAEEQWRQGQGGGRHYTPGEQQYPAQQQYGHDTEQYPAYGYQQGGYDTGTGQYPAYGYQQGGYDTGTGQYPAYGYDTGQYPAQPQYGYDTGTGQYPAYGYPQGGYGTGTQPVHDTGQSPAVVSPAAPTVPEPSASPEGGTQGRDGSYQTEEFAFVDDEEESSQDVIDWLKFSETRGERRDERRRKIRGRLISLLVVLVLCAAGGAGYLFATGKLKLGGATGSGGAAAPTQRQVIAVYLRNHVNGQTATALLSEDPASGKGTAVLVPDTLQLPQDAGGSALQLGNSWDSQGSTGTTDGLNNVLGTGITGTWRLDDPFLASLVDVLGGITVNADTAITQNGKQLVSQGSQTMNGAAAEAYATYQGPGESRSAQLARFGQVLAAVIKAFPADNASAIADVDRMGAVLDPTLPEKTLGPILAALSADSAKGAYSTVTLPVSGGSLASGAAGTVQQLLGGRTQGSAGAGTVARVLVDNASGSPRSLDLAQAAVQNGGFTLVSGGATQSAQSRTQVLYADDTRKGEAQQLAQDLGLPATAAVKGSVPATADVLIVLGKDYTG